jgi:dolichol-phosphate mannosyltransferase
MSSGQTENPAILIFISQIVNVVFRLALRLKCYDVSNSFAFTGRRRAGATFRNYSRFDIVEEILVKLTVLSRISDQEIAVHVRQRKGGKTKRQLLVFILDISHALASARLKAKPGAHCAPHEVSGHLIVIVGCNIWRN